MAPPLFVYGTLRDPHLLGAVLARPLSANAVRRAAAPGYIAVHYPALVRRPGGSAPGLALLDLTPFERDLLDAYEGEEYRRGIVAVMIDEELHEAEVYLPTVAIDADAPDWTLEHWQATYKDRVLAGEAANADILRQRLIAVRPH